MIIGKELTQQDKNFLIKLKDKGVSQDEAFKRLSAVKTKQQPESPGLIQRGIGAIKEQFGGGEGFGATAAGIAGAVANPIGTLTDIARKTIDSDKAAGVIKEGISSGVQQVKQGLAKSAEGKEMAIQEENVPGFNPSTKRQIGGGLDVIQGALGTVAAPIAGAVTAIPGGETALNVVGGALNKLSQFGSDKLIQALGVDPESEDAQLIRQGLEVGVDLAPIPFVPKGVRTAGRAVEQAIDVGLPAVKQAGDIVIGSGDALKTFTSDQVLNLSKKLVDPENVLQNLNRIKPKQVNDFAKLNQGKTPAQWLIERDIIEPPAKTVETLTERAKQAQNVLDESLAQIDATYKPNELLDPIVELKETFQTTKPYGGAEVELVNGFANKLGAEGLTLSEINQLKRIYERNVKVNYLRENNPKSIARANEIDSFMRNFVRDEAEKAGVPDVKRLSNEIQSSYNISNAIVDTFEGRKGNNPFSINDFILMGGAIADLTSGGAILAGKKIFESPKYRAAFVRAATKGDIKAMKELPNVPVEIIKIKNAERRNLEFQKWASENGIYSALGKETPKALPAGTTIQLPKPSFETMSEAYRKGEMVSEPLSDVDRAKPPSDFNKAGSAKSALIQEAKKYKTADEFVKAKGTPVYHGTLAEFDNFDGNKAGSNTEWGNAKFGTFFLDDAAKAKEFPELARMAGDNRTVKVKEAYIDLKNPIDLTLKGIFTNKKQAPLIVELLGGEKMSPTNALDYLNENIGLGDIGDLTEELYSDIANKKLMQDAGHDGMISDYGDGIIEKVVFDTKQIKTKSQLTEIFNKANTKTDPLTQEAKKYKTQGSQSGTIEQDTNSLDSLYKKAPQAKEYVDMFADNLTKGTNATVAKTPIKSLESAKRKVANDYKGNASLLTDIARNTIVGDSKTIKRIASKLQGDAKVISFKEINSKMDSLGYSGYNVKIKTPYQIVEVQMNTPEMIFAKETAETAKSILGDKYEIIKKKADAKGLKGGQGHLLYEEHRAKETSPSRRTKIEEASKEYFNTIRAI